MTKQCYFPFPLWSQYSNRYLTKFFIFWLHKNFGFQSAFMTPRFLWPNHFCDFSSRFTLDTGINNITLVSGSEDRISADGGLISPPTPCSTGGGPSSGSGGSPLSCSALSNLDSLTSSVSSTLPTTLMTNGDALPGSAANLNGSLMSSILANGKHHHNGDLNHLAAAKANLGKLMIWVLLLYWHLRDTIVPVGKQLLIAGVNFPLVWNCACKSTYSLLFWHILPRDLARTKSQGGQRPQMFQKFTPQIRKITFFCIFTLQFQKVSGVSWPRWPRARKVPA